MKKVLALLLSTITLLGGNILNVHAETIQEPLPDYEVVEEFDVYSSDIIDICGSKNTGKIISYGRCFYSDWTWNQCGDSSR